MSGGVPSSIRELASQAAALPEPAMRVPLAARLLNERPARESVQLLSAVLSAQRRGSALLTLLDALTGALQAGAVGYERLSELYAEAKDAGLDEVCGILAAPGLARPVGPHESSGLDPAMAEVSLGRRKSLARRPDHQLVARLLHDPEPAVIRNLLMNPRLTLTQVLRIATKRPIPPAVLMELAQNQRWARRYEVRRALVLNPHTPQELAARLLATLLDQDVAMLASEPTISPNLRAVARRLLSVRRAPDQPVDAELPDHE